MTLPKPIKIDVERYVGGLSQFKKIDNPIKLSANESALGPSPKAIQAFEQGKDKIFVRSTFRQEDVVEFTFDEWEVFVKGVKSGEFDI